MLQDFLGRTPLHYAALYGYDAVARELTLYGSDLKTVDKLGFTPLQYCARLGTVEKTVKEAFSEYQRQLHAPVRFDEFVQHFRLFLEMHPSAQATYDLAIAEELDWVATLDAPDIREIADQISPQDFAENSYTSAVDPTLLDRKVLVGGQLVLEGLRVFTCMRERET
jgi:Ankyrin repeats (3 copies)